MRASKWGEIPAYAGMTVMGGNDGYGREWRDWAGMTVTGKAWRRRRGGDAHPEPLAMSGGAAAMGAMLIANPGGRRLHQ